MNDDDFAKALVADFYCSSKDLDDFRFLSNNGSVRYCGAYSNDDRTIQMYKYHANASIYFAAFETLVSKGQIFYMNWDSERFDLLEIEHEPIQRI